MESTWALWKFWFMKALMARYEDYGENFSYIQEDFMFDLAAKRGWHWNIIRPMGIIGYTPAGMSHGF